MVNVIQKHKFRKLPTVEKIVLDNVGLEVVIEDKEMGSGHGVITSSKPRKTPWQRIINGSKTGSDYNFVSSDGYKYRFRYANLQVLYTGLSGCRDIIDSFVDAPSIGGYVNPKAERERLSCVIVKVLSTYGVDRVNQFVKLIEQHRTWSRLTLAEMTLCEDMDTVIEALSSSFSNEVAQYKGALKKRIAYEKIKNEGIQKEDLEEKTISITRRCFLWNSEEETEKWDLKGYIDDVGGEIFQIQGHPMALQGFIKYLKAMDGICTVKVSECDISDIYKNLTGGTKWCDC